MTAQKHLRVTLTLPIDPPHPFIAHNAGYPQALANRVQWERVITDDADNIRATVFSEDYMNRSYYYYPEYDPTPDWVPTPPASWVALVTGLAEELTR